MLPNNNHVLAHAPSKAFAKAGECQREVLGLAVLEGLGAESQMPSGQGKKGIFLLVG